MRARLALNVQYPNGDMETEAQHEIRLEGLPEAGQWLSAPGGVDYTVSGVGWVLDSAAQMVPYVTAFRRAQ